jgi:8-oxo-dGTP pyrophosphatase MutT (NUDIX family)
MGASQRCSLFISIHVTEIRVGVIDVFVLRRSPEPVHVLVMRRAAGTRCTGAWEVVHGRIDGAETPETAAIREVKEETGLDLERLYNVICQPFYLHKHQTVQIAVVFAAFVDDVSALALSPEHDRAEWLTVEAALERLSWPRSRTALRDAISLLRQGDAGPVEDVLRVR